MTTKKISQPIGLSKPQFSGRTSPNKKKSSNGVVSKRKFFTSSKSNHFSMMSKEINKRDLRDNRALVSKPSTTIKIMKKNGKEKIKIQLRKNSLSIPRFESNDISSGLSDIKKSYIPDFGYQNQLEFTEMHGWGFLLDFISKYPKREKTANMMSDLMIQKE